MTLDDIRQLLATNDRAVERAVVAIYRRQTASEQQSRSTQKENGVGFNAPDARVLSIYAQALLNQRTITDFGRRDMRARIMKYSGQLLSIATENALQKLSKEPS